MAESIFEAYNRCKRELSAYGVEDYVFESKQIIKHITGYTNMQILTKYNERLNPIEERQLSEIIEKRKIHYPLQYIFGKWSFYGREYTVGTGVLIPRADTEVLADKALELIKEIKSPKIMDLCAGTGCIGITLGLERPDSTVLLFEKYSEAAMYAEQNIKLNKADNVTLLKGDVLTYKGSEERYDLIISNPPYITDNDMKKLQAEVEYEPKSALAGGADGCDFYRAIINNFKSALNSGGYIAFEVGIGQADTVASLLESAGFTDVGKVSDYGGVERVVFGTAR